MIHSNANGDDERNSDMTGDESTSTSCDSPDILAETGEPEAVGEFYGAAERYWSSVPATIDGMLGGYEGVSENDISTSRQFIQKLNLTSKKRSVDCGAGIGRITRNLLLPLFDTVDMVEVTKSFINQSYNYIAASEYKDRMGQRYCVGLQDFIPDENSYDVIWCQWVLGHLTDSALVEFLKRCVKGLRQTDTSTSFIVIKENVLSEPIKSCATFDDVDSSYTRSMTLLQTIFKRAGLKVILQEKQKNFPSVLLPVHFFALMPV